jgi:Ca2+-binding EF-hand superfamily protein
MKAFKDSDIDGSNELDYNEMKRLCEEMGLPMSNNEEEEILKMDKDGSNTLDLQEWLSFWLKRVSCLPNPAKQQEAIARNTFNKFDKEPHYDKIVSSTKLKYSRQKP